jgi:S1-C subfamily serine protease
MRTILIAALVVLLAIPAAPALAGSGQKCSKNTQACLNAFAGNRDKGWLGLKYEEDAAGKVVVKSMAAGSPSEGAGFQVGDVLVAMNGVKFADKEAIKKAKADWKTGAQVTYTVSRANAETQVVATLAPMPEEVFAAMVGTHMIESHMTVPAVEKAQATKK